MKQVLQVNCLACILGRSLEICLFGRGEEKSWKGPTKIFEANCLTASSLTKLKHMTEGIIQLPLEHRKV